ncbi:MAG: right-handed parallel beta-helix repeat-containing protein, partial [Candidatus Eisenbacteria bacterium]|nr:right-handed parallel beta-helix repeat-containing protein [Candidatus Eisenbacteria bacterium]
VVGIMGIAGRERSNIIVRDNRIFRNSWDGIALYRGSQAVIEGNIIDGVDLARGNQVGGGRGVGIGLTWNSFATVRGNLVRNYWKGIGVFVDAQATIEENVIEHMATWGLTLWDAGEGLPSGTFRRNVVYKTGACGASIARGRSELNPGQFVQNVLVSTAQDPKYDSGEPYCLQVPIDQHGVPENFPISANVLFQNREAGQARYRDDLPRAAFEARMQPIWNALDRWPRLSKSDFWRTFHPEPKEPVEAVPQTNEGATPTGDPPN